MATTQKQFTLLVSSSTTFFQTSFESNPPSNPCALNLGPLPGSGDVGSLVNINSNANSPSDTRSTDLTGHTGVAHTGFCSALDYNGTGVNNFPELDGGLANGGGLASAIWYRVWVYFSPTWVDCSQPSHPCSSGAQHMFRWWAGDGNHPQFTIGLPVQGDVFEIVAECGVAGNPYCAAGGQVYDAGLTGTWRISQHRGAWHCLEMNMVANTPGHADGAMAWYVDGVLDGNHGGFNLYGTHPFDGLPQISMGSNLGGSTGGTGYPLNSNYFFVDDVVVSQSRPGC